MVNGYIVPAFLAVLLVFLLEFLSFLGFLILIKVFEFHPAGPSIDFLQGYIGLVVLVDLLGD